MQKHILIITNEQDLHTDVVVQELASRHESVIRINTDAFLDSLGMSFTCDSDSASCFLAKDGEHIDVSEIKSVWYRKPVPPKVARLYQGAHKTFVEDEARQALEGFMLLLQDCYWINPCWKLDVASNKLRQLKNAMELGFSIPRTLVTTNVQELMEFYERCSGRVVYKTLFAPVIDYESHSTIIRTHQLIPSDISSMSQTLTQPCLFQELIEKSLEIRVTVVGDRIFSAELHTQDLDSTRIDWRRIEGFHGIKYAKHDLPIEINEKIRSFLKRDGLVYGAFDFILTPQGEYVFLENNPNGEWLWIQINLDLNIAQGIADALVLAL